jgi:hypothetical protein
MAVTQKSPINLAVKKKKQDSRITEGEGQDQTAHQSAWVLHHKVKSVKVKTKKWTDCHSLKMSFD